MSERKFGVVPADVLLSQSGLDFLQGVIDGRLPAPPIAETLGFQLVAVEKGRAIFEGMPQHRHYNPIGVVHGGFAMTLLDSALGCSVHTTLDKGDAYTTLEIKVNLVRPLTKDTGLDPRGRTHPASRTHARHGGRRDQGCERQALRARHDDVHDLPGEKAKLLSACRWSRAWSAARAAANRCRPADCPARSRLRFPPDRGG